MDQVVRDLLAAGADHSVPDRHSGWTVAHVAASLGSVPILDALIKHKANMSAADDQGDTVLHAAVRAGHLGPVQRLLNLPNVDPEAVNQQGQTPLHTLAKYPREQSVALLQAMFPRLHGNVNPQDAEGNTPLYYAYDNGAGPLCKALIVNGAHLGLVNKMGQFSCTCVLCMLCVVCVVCCVCCGVLCVACLFLKFHIIFNNHLPSFTHTHRRILFRSQSQVKETVVQAVG